MPKITSLWLLDHSREFKKHWHQQLEVKSWLQSLSLWPWPNQMTLISLGILGRLNHWLQLSPTLPCTHTTAMASLWMERDHETCFSQRNMSGGQCVISEPALKRPCMFCSLSYILSPTREKLILAGGFFLPSPESNTGVEGPYPTTLDELPRLSGTQEK